MKFISYLLKKILLVVFVFILVFSSFRIQKAEAAITYQTPGALAYSASGGTTVSPAYPASIVAGELLVLMIGMKPNTANGGSVTTPSGWTPITSLTGAGGYGTTLGADTGNTNIFSFYKVAVGGETGTLAVTIATNGVSWAQMYRLSAAGGSTWSVAGTTGSDVAAGNVSIATSTNPGVTTGDFILGGMVIPTDVTTAAQFTAEAITQTGVTFGTVTEISEPDSTTGNDIGGFTFRAPVSSGTSSAAPAFTATAAGTTTNVRGPGVFIRIREVAGAATTTIADGTDPGNSTLAPSAAIADLDAFTLTASTGTDSVTGLTVTLTGTSSFDSLSEVRITSDNGSVLYFSAVANPASNTVVFSGGTPIPVTTSATQFKVRITPKTHANMPVPPGLSYTVGGTVTAFTSTNAQAGNDSTTPASLTVDNLSPNGATSVSGTAGDTANTINWTTSSSADFNTTSGSVIYRWTSGSAGSEVPVEGSTPSIDTTNGTATVVCVISSAASSAQSKINGTGGSAGCSTATLTNGQVYTYKAFQKDTNGNYDVGVLIGSFTPAVSISLTSYTNSTETGLNYAGACTGCGARIGGGAGFRQTIVLSGSGFGADPGVGNRSSATNNIKVGAQQIASANVTAWSNTSITFLTDSAVTGDTDTDWGADFGGASALVVTAGGSASPGLNFYVFPQITSVTQPAGFGADTAREYDAGDTDGVITLNGTRFGTAQGSGSVTIVSQSGTTNSWTNTAIEVRVPTTITDTVNTGSIAMTQGTGSNGKTHTYANTLRILPRITSFTPTSASEGTAVTINGNHFCQNVSCPASFDVNNKVVFNSAVQATTFTSWSATAIATEVPIGSVTGNVVVTSNAFTSNGLSFTVLSNTPAPPTSLNQWSNSGLTTAISIGGATNSSTVYLTMIMEVSGISGGTLYPQIEYKPIGTAFTCGVGACVGATTGTGVAGPGPVDCGNTGNACSISITPVDDEYHWQARVKHTKNSIDYYSSWVSFGEGNPESSTDFKVDTTGPVITSISSGTPGGNNATITWNTASEISTSRVEYDTNGTFIGGYDCAGTSECTALADTSPMVNSHSVSLSNLNSGTTYYYRVRSKDVAGNETISSTSTFNTQSITTPAKTVKSHINGATGLISAAETYYFTVHVPETSPSIKNSYVEVIGIASGGTGTVAIEVNGVGIRTYDVSAGSPTQYRFLYKITNPNTETNLNLNDAAPCSNSATPGTAPLCNKIIITPTTVSLNILSAKIINMYAYTP